MGKRQIGELQPFELVITLIFADVATIPMADTSIPLLNGIIPLVTLVVLQFFLSFLSRKSRYIRKAINGKPVIVINPDGIDYKNLKALNMSLNDLTEALRGCSVVNLDEVLYAIIETNGKTSIILRSENSPVTNEDIKLKKLQHALPMIIISEGKINVDNAKLANLSEDKIKEILSQAKIKNYKDILIMTINNNGKVYLQTIEGSYQVIQDNDFKGGENW